MMSQRHDWVAFCKLQMILTLLTARQRRASSSRGNFDGFLSLQDGLQHSVLLRFMPPACSSAIANIPAAVCLWLDRRITASTASCCSCLTEADIGNKSPMVTQRMKYPLVQCCSEHKILQLCAGTWFNFCIYHDAPSLNCAGAKVETAKLVNTTSILRTHRYAHNLHYNSTHI